MTLYELLFILLVLSFVIVVIGSVILAVTGRGAAALKILLAAGAVWCVYIAALVVSDLTARPLVIAAGDNRCFDEMCFAVVKAQILSSSSAQSDRILHVVTIQLTSRSRGRTQRESGLRARLYDDGRYFSVSAQEQKKYELEHGKSPGLTQRLAPGESIQSVLVFDLPRNAAQPELTLDHGFTPGYFVIGESPFFHGPDVLTLPQD